MSKISLKPALSGTATFTIEAPATNTDRIFELPDEAGKVLTSASNLAGVTGVGKVLQVVQGTLAATGVNITSTSLVDTGVSASITPTSTSSKILIIVAVNVSGQSSSSSSRSYFLSLLRGATEIVNNAASAYGALGLNGLFESSIDGSIVFLDTPNTTSSTTYKVQGRVGTSAMTMRINQDNRGTSTITLMEIAG